MKIQLTAAEIIHNGNQSTGRPVKIDTTIEYEQLEEYRQQFMQEHGLNEEFIVNFVYKHLEL